MVVESFGKRRGTPLASFPRDSDDGTIQNESRSAQVVSREIVRPRELLGIAAIMWLAILFGFFDDRKEKKKPPNRAA
ncbi:MAG: hypothetical protein DMF87_25805 [Acidobacteria bacterium]|nr:MAG: hypothetical protein DMF88_09075 [Acidobacteriota bacterium]PYR73442.1 MAG: hypothetical protein DMF87_25805 [Acidobacteriota bacterium]